MASSWTTKTMKDRRGSPARVRSRQGVARTVILLLTVVAFLSTTTPAASGQSGAGRTDETDSDEPRPAVDFTPPNLLQSADRTNIERIAAELAAYGATVGVTVRRVDAPAEDTQTAAQELYEDRPIESAPEAGDGLLILVEIPRGAPRMTTIGFAAGPNFYPRGGLNPDRLREVVATEVQPLIDRNNVGDAIVTLMQWTSVIHLFEQGPRVELTERQGVLNDVLDRVAAPLLTALALALGGVAWWVGRRTRRLGPIAAADREALALDAVEAGALARGRVDAAVLTGALLQLHERGAVTVVPERKSVPTLRLTEDVGGLDPKAGLVWAAVGRLAKPGSDDVPPPHLRQLPDGWEDARAGIERALYTRTLFDPGARRADALLRFLALVAAAAAVLLVIPTLVARSGAAIAAEILLLAVAVVVWQWSCHRSWTTANGAFALHAWRDRLPVDDPQRVLYDVITRQERAADNRFLSIRGPFGERAYRPLNALITTVRSFGQT